MKEFSKPRSFQFPRFHARRSRAGGFWSRLVPIVLSTFLVVGGTALADDDEASEQHVFVGATKCKTCHKKEAIGNQYGVWLDSKHAKAFETLAGEQAAKWAAEAGVEDPQASEKCVKCHVTAYGVSSERLATSFKQADGVQCESCHGAGKDYRKKKIMIDQDLAISKGLIPAPKEEDCRACHNDESPAWKDDRYTLADGSKVGFDFEQAKEAIAHPVPEGYDPAAHGGAD